MLPTLSSPKVSLTSVFDAKRGAYSHLAPQSEDLGRLGKGTPQILDAFAYSKEGGDGSTVTDVRWLGGNGTDCPQWPGLGTAALRVSSWWEWSVGSGYICTLRARTEQLPGANKAPCVLLACTHPLKPAGISFSPSSVSGD